MTTENVRLVVIDGTSSERRYVCQIDTGFPIPNRPTFAIEVPPWVQSTLKPGDVMTLSMQPSQVEAVGGGSTTSDVTVYTFAPGGVADPTNRIYTTWATLLAAHNADTGQRAIYFDNSATPIIIPTVPGSAATGSITAVAGSALVDGETFTLNDGVNPATIFEFDSNSSVTVGHVAVTFTALDTSAQVATTIRAAINGVGAGLAITAAVPVGAVVGLTNDAVGTAGNIAITDTVADSGFTTTGMSGGTNSFASTFNNRTRLLPKPGSTTPMAITLNSGVVLSQPYYLSPLLNFQA